MTLRHIEVHIEEIVLHGVDPADRRAVGDAIREELGRLFAEGGLPGAMAGGDVAELGGTFDTPSPARGAALGVSVARAAYRGEAPR
jgi:hypothetical protein